MSLIMLLRKRPGCLQPTADTMVLVNVKHIAVPFVMCQAVSTSQTELYPLSPPPSLSFALFLSLTHISPFISLSLTDNDDNIFVT